MKQLFRQLVVPAALAAAAVAVIAWAQHGADRAEAGVLAGGELAERIWEHMALCAVSTALAVLAAVPAGIAATRSGLRRLAPPLLFLANVGQSVPTIAVLALAFSVTGIGFRTAVIGLWAYSLLPVLRNTVAGLAGVDPATVEAARGMGMSPGQVLWRVELPLAGPVVMAGIRTAAVVNVGTAALATFVGAGGLGELITVGLDNQRDRVLYTGAALTALLALAVDWALGTVAGITRRAGR
ncbi:MAG: ABC transporter permease [Actinomycetota bacterium]|jgi:osmoprotectant transport system permease protein